MDNLFLVKDFENTSSGVVDHNNIPSSYGHRICNLLNQQSGYINFKGGDKDFYAIPSESSLSPENIYVKATFISGYPNDFSFSANMNGINLFTTTFQKSGVYELSGGEYRISKSGYFTPSSLELNKLVQSKTNNINDIKHDFLKISVSSGSSLITDYYKLCNLEIAYGGRSYKPNSSIAPDIKSFYPSSITGNSYTSLSGINASDPNNVKGPTNSSGNDSLWIKRDSYNSLYYNDDGYEYDGQYLQFGFNTSGVILQDNRNIEKCVFSVRVNNLSGNETNNQNWCRLGLFNGSIDKAIGYGSGFLVNNKNSFTMLESEICFIDDGLPSDKYKIVGLMDNFYIRLYQLPVEAKISSAQVDLYTLNSNSFNMAINGNVNSKSGILEPRMSSEYNPGYNRLKRSSYESGIFDVYKPLYSGDSITIRYTPEIWSNYYNEKIDTTDNNRHQYNNYLYLKENNYITQTLNTTDKFSVMFMCSTSGRLLPSGDEGYGNPYYDDCIEAGSFSYDYLRSRFGATLLEKKTGSNTDFKLHIEDEKIKISVKDGAYTQNGEFNSESTSLILITGKKSGYFNLFDVYSFDQNGSFTKAFSTNTTLNGGIGNLYIGGSGINDFNGYLHEYGIGSKYLDYQDILDFQRSRYTISKVLEEDNILELDIRNVNNKNIKDSFTVNFNSMSESSGIYQNEVSSFSYDTIVTNRNSYLVQIDYQSNNNVNISGVYSENYRAGGISGPDINNNINFKQRVLNSGIHSVILEPYTFANELVRPNIDYHMYSKFDFEINSGEGKVLIHDTTSDYLLDDNSIAYLIDDNSYSVNNLDFKINDIKILFNGFYLASNLINSIPIITVGKTSQYSGLDFYIGNQISDTGLDFYTLGKSNYSGYLDFYTTASITQQSGINFITSSKLIGYNGLDFYTKGPIIYDTTANEGVIEMFLGASTEISFKPLAMFTKSIPYISGYPSGYYPPDGYSFFYDSINFFTKYTEEKTKESINFFTKSDTITDQHINMYLPNNQSNTKYQLDFTLPCSYNQSGGINMFIKGI